MTPERLAVPDTVSAVLTIDLGAVRENYRRLAARVHPGECAAVVKADAYGLGIETVVPTLAAAGCRTFFVATPEEGAATRALLDGQDHPAAVIAVFNGLAPGSERHMAEHRLVPVLNSLEELAAWRRFTGDRPDRPAALHVDSGMSRLGLDRRQIRRLLAEPDRLAGLPLAWLMSHACCADVPDQPENARQLAYFRDVLTQVQGLLSPGSPGSPGISASLAASSAIFLGPDWHFDLVRPGLALYGGNPVPQQPSPMMEVITLQGRILQVRDIDRGESVGYGAAWTADRPTRVATIAAGYADGILRSGSHRLSAVIAGHPVPLLGRISMDLTTFDVTDVPADRLRPGAFATLIGGNGAAAAGAGHQGITGHQDINSVAQQCGTIPYEILTSLGRRYHRVHRGMPSAPVGESE